MPQIYEEIFLLLFDQNRFNQRFLNSILNVRFCNADTSVDQPKTWLVCRL